MDLMQGKNYNEQYELLLAARKKYPALPRLFKIYIMDSCVIINAPKIMCMMKYYGVEKTRNIDSIGEIGEFAASRTRLLKIKEFKWMNQNTIEVNMSNVEFLITTYQKMKKHAYHKQQYKILKNCFMLLSHTDVKWFTRILCNRLQTNKAIREVIKYDQIQSDM